MKLIGPFSNRAGQFGGTRKSLWLAVLLVVGRNWNLLANPAGMAVVSGSGRAEQLGSQLNVTVSRLAVLNWGSFNIKPGETTTFLQPSANSVVFNQIGGANPSQIFGNLNANGTVILANANGFYFGPNSMISVGGSFIATTAPITPDFGAGSAWQFTGMPPLASIVNYGRIKVGPEKSLYLIAEQIENHGELAAPGGDVGLYAGESVLVSERPDGRGLSATMKVPRGAVNNFGQIIADAGTIALQAQVVNQDGILQADSVSDKNGVIELVAADSLDLGADSQTLARGDDTVSGSPGGSVTIKSENIFSDSAGSRIATTGGAKGGNGGDVEISAPNIQTLNSVMDASAQTGWNGGKFLLDPVDIVLGASTANGAINVNTAFAGFSTILLQATGNISINANTTWNLSSSTSQTTGQLTLEAGGDITFGNSSKIFDANNWSMTLEAGYDFVNNVVQSGVGSIYLNGGSGLSLNGSIQLAAGSINLLAGQSILLASPNTHNKGIISGSVFTTGGGSIFAEALAGNIDAGTSNGGTGSTTQTSDYNFGTTGAKLNTILGGIATASGGDVTLIAGNDIDSTPVVASKQWPAASGAYGSGNVTIIAGNQINGNFMLANGVGTILAGVPVQSEQAAKLQNPAADPVAYASTMKDLETAVTQTQNPNGNIGGIEFAGGANLAVTLSLIQGSWNAWAANNIFLKEVNNPNGTFNTAQSYLYNYAPDASANFWAGNAIELAGGTTGGTLARLRGGNQNIIFAPGLTLNAGAGGIQIDKSIIMAPSSVGSLEIITRDGGNLSGPATTTLNGITMSDSDSTDYRTFGTTHAATPLHLNDPNPVLLNISGNINSFSLTVPTFAQINVVGDTFNFGFLGQNLQPGDETSINVGETAKENMENSGVLNPAKDANLRVGGSIGYQSFSAANPSGTLGNQGLDLAGPGRFVVTAQNIDLGVSDGISVLAPDAVLAAISPIGANLNITTSGNLDMTSTRIANQSFLGGIELNVGSALDVGGEFTAFGDPSSPKGIFTTSGGNVSVVALGNVNVNGSRIAAYDGGNINVKSLNGDVNAGAGGSGYVTLQALELNPVTQQLVGIPATIPGSGILATTVVGSDATLGDITVSAPNGSINASSGGILQIAFNGVGTLNNLIDLNAGLDIVATGSGVIGVNVKLHAGRTVTGLFVAQHTVDATAQNFGPGLLFGPTVHAQDSGDNGGGVPIQIVSENPIAENGITVPASAPDVASAPKEVAQTAADSTTVAANADDQSASAVDDQKKKKAITLAQKVGRVTINLPTKTN
jgi:filamentous hemagglutinin family protein